MAILFWVLLATGATQQTPDSESNQQPDPKQPSLELLEFLGSFETIDGDWIDPMSFEEQYEREAKAQDHETDKNEIGNQDSDPDSARLH